MNPATVETSPSLRPRLVHGARAVFEHAGANVAAASAALAPVDWIVGGGDAPSSGTAVVCMADSATVGISELNEIACRVSGLGFRKLHIIAAADFSPEALSIAQSWGVQVTNGSEFDHALHQLPSSARIELDARLAEDAPCGEAGPLSSAVGLEAPALDEISYHLGKKVSRSSETARLIGESMVFKVCVCVLAAALMWKMFPYLQDKVAGVRSEVRGMKLASESKSIDTEQWDPQSSGEYYPDDDAQKFIKALTINRTASPPFDIAAEDSVLENMGAMVEFAEDLRRKRKGGRYWLAISEFDDAQLTRCCKCLIIKNGTLTYLPSARGYAYDFVRSDFGARTYGKVNLIELSDGDLETAMHRIVGYAKTKKISNSSDAHWQRLAELPTERFPHIAKHLVIHNVADRGKSLAYNAKIIRNSEFVRNGGSRLSAETVAQLHSAPTIREQGDEGGGADTQGQESGTGAELAPERNTRGKDFSPEEIAVLTSLEIPDDAPTFAALDHLARKKFLTEQWRAAQLGDERHFVVARALIDKEVRRLPGSFALADEENMEDILLDVLDTAGQHPAFSLAVTRLILNPLMVYEHLQPIAIACVEEGDPITMYQMGAMVAALTDEPQFVGAAMISLMEVLEATDGFSSLPEGVAVDILFGRYSKLLMEKHHDRMVAIIAGNDDVPDWLMNLVQAHSHLMLAKAADEEQRHGGNMVEAPRRGLAELEKACDCLQRSYEANPRRPEAAAMMISLSTDFKRPLSEARMWFDRAISACADFDDAYVHYRKALAPTHGGSEDLQEAFAHSCLNTGRFDTAIPKSYLLIHGDLGKQTTDSARYWAEFTSEEIGELEEMFAGYRGALPPHIYRSHYPGWEIGVWHACGQNDKLVRAYEEFAEPLSLEVVTALPVRLDEIKAAAESYQPSARAVSAAADESREPE